MIISERCSRISFFVFFFFQAEDGIRDLVRSRGLGDVYKRQPRTVVEGEIPFGSAVQQVLEAVVGRGILELHVVGLSLIHI